MCRLPSTQPASCQRALGLVRSLHAEGTGPSTAQLAPPQFLCCRTGQVHSASSQSDPVCQFGLSTSCRKLSGKRTAQSLHDGPQCLLAGCPTFQQLPPLLAAGLELLQCTTHGPASTPDTQPHLSTAAASPFCRLTSASCRERASLSEASRSAAACSLAVRSLSRAFCFSFWRRSRSARSRSAASSCSTGGRVAGCQVG